MEPMIAETGAAPAAPLPSLIGLSREKIAEALAIVGVPEKQRRMRASQLWHWLYVRGASDFGAMTNIAKELRAELAEAFSLARPEIVTEQRSTDGTVKWLLRFPSRGAGRPVEVETVYIPEEDRGTLCISSQVGCTLNCAFCHTGTQTMVRNLTADEILGQLLLARDRLGDFPDAATPAGAIVPGEGRRISNIVMMGMGEPLYNFDNVRDALLVASDGEGLGLSKRRITLSTAGVVPMIAARGRRDRHHARHLAARRPRRSSRRHRADQQEVPDRRIARGLPRLSRPFQRPPHHLRICHAQGRQ